ncbi:MAG: VOC family protein [Micromonosporaceae bacterium]|nr:VOC family protein [Micromonosporaceae bacterium]
MTPMPIRYVRDLDAARRFYLALGLRLGFASRPPRRGPTQWVELRGGEGALALHHAPPAATRVPPIELAFEADEPLEAVVERLRTAGFEPTTGIVDESFGRSFTVHDPEGLLIQVNEHDRELQR